MTALGAQYTAKCVCVTTKVERDFNLNLPVLTAVWIRIESVLSQMRRTTAKCNTVELENAYYDHFLWMASLFLTKNVNKNCSYSNFKNLKCWRASVSRDGI